MKNNLFSVAKNNHVEFFYDGLTYCDKFLETIRSAQHSIHLQTYIFWMDEFGSRVHNELLRAAKRGVAVYVLVDSIGSRLLETKDEEPLRRGGVYFCRFNGFQWKWLYRWGRRLHHKILLVDHSKSIIGGINVVNPCPPGTDEPKLDFAVYTEGPVNKELTEYCQNVFNSSCEKSVIFKSTQTAWPLANGLEVGISVNDWVHRRRKITQQYFRLTNQAQSDILIINSYFFPRRKFMRRLVAAAKRGVRVRLILPKYSDWPSYILASEYLYEYFLKRGVEIYLWDKSIMHGKLAIVDDQWATIGSFNLNYTSYQQNLEMNIDIYSDKYIHYLRDEIEKMILNGCEKIDPQLFMKKSSFKIRAIRFVFYIMLALIAGFSIGLSFQEDNNKENRFYSILRIITSLVFFLMGIIGALLPIVPGFPFFIISFLLVYRQILLNKKLG